MIWFLPRSGAMSVPSWMTNYTFFNRCAPPSYLEFYAILKTLLCIGVVDITEKHRLGFRLTIRSDWYDRVHERDDDDANEAENINACCELLCHEEFAIERDVDLELSEDDYQLATRSARY